MKENQKTPHVHAEVIKAWADGAKVQFWSDITREWQDSSNQPQFYTNFQYRVKPEPKPDVVKYQGTVMREHGHASSGGLDELRVVDHWPNVVKYTFDGETRKLKSVEIVQ
jgi:hypothetical protein